MKINEDLIISIKEPNSLSAIAAFELIQNSPPLELNSMYCYLLQCSHFSETSAIAIIDEKMIGFVSGYLKPKDNNVLFIWQIAVDKNYRREGVGLRMLESILCRPFCKNVSFIETTITKNNLPSRSLFNKFGNSRGTLCQEDVLFDKSEHQNRIEDTELLLRIKC